MSHTQHLRSLQAQAKVAFRARDCTRAWDIARRFTAAVRAGNDKEWRQAMNLQAAASRCRVR